MKSFSLLPVLLLEAVPTFALPRQARNSPPPSNSLLNNSGFENATLSHSLGGHAICVSGNVPVSVSATNYKINLGQLINQTVVTNDVVEIVQINSTFPEQSIQGNSTVAGTYSINAKLCLPVSGNNNSSTIQFLTHGIAFDKAYWDFAEGYSYVDAAAVAGHATFFYDRLGTGQSDHPDPTSVLQGPLEVEIAHSLIQSLRNGSFQDGQKYTSVVGVGHSFGSSLTQAVTAYHPADFDAAVLTAFSTDDSAMGATLFAFNPQIASVNQPERFSDLPNGYLVTQNSISMQLTFLRAPYFDPKIAEAAEATKQTFTLAEMLTLGLIAEPAASFNGSVFVIDGENDFIFCQANCSYPTDQAALVLEKLYPAANNLSQSYIIPNTGHGINLHYTAPEAYQKILGFVQSIGV